MLTNNFDEFRLLFNPEIDDQSSKIRKLVYLAVSCQVNLYAKEMILSPKEVQEITTSNDRHQIFYRKIATEEAFDTLNLFGKADPCGLMSVSSKWYERTKNLTSGDGDSLFVLAVYYWFHLDESRMAYARYIDYAVFEKPIHLQFNLNRDQFYFPLRESKLIKLKSIEITNDPDLANLPLPRDFPSSIMIDGQPDISSALNWKYNLTQMYGRDDDLSELLNWAQTDNNEVKVRLLHGVGGSGKTRLAFEAADKLDLLQWNAGFMGRDYVDHPTVYGDKNGIFIVIDYPEERMEFVDNLINELWGLQEAYLPVRILLVSRLGPENWTSTQFKLQHRFSVQRTSSTNPLSVDDAIIIIAEATEVLSGLMKREEPELIGVRDWLQKDTLHRLPLFALAYGIHTVVGDGQSYEMSGKDLLLKMARFELERVRSFARPYDQSEKWLERILALSIFSGAGLGQDAVTAIGDAGATGALREQALIDTLSKTPWQKSGRWHVLKLEPDRFAVAFLIVSLLDDTSKYLPSWIGSVVKNDTAEFLPLLSRVLYDLSEFSRQHQVELEQAVSMMIEQDYALVENFRHSELTGFSILSAPFALQINLRLKQASSDKIEQALLMQEESVLLARTGDYQGALNAANQAVAYWKKLLFREGDKHLLNYSQSMSIQSSCLADLGRFKEALEASKKAFESFPEPTSNSDLSLVEYAECLLTYCAQLDKMNEHNLAVGSGLQGLQIYQKFYAEAPDLYADPLARAYEKAALIFKSFDNEHSRDFITKALVIRRKLAESEPDVQLEHLGDCLISYSDVHYSLIPFEHLQEVTEEAVRIFQNLRTKRPNLFANSYSRALREASNICSELGNKKRALEHMEKAVLVMEENWVLFRDPYDEEFASAMSGNAFLKSNEGGIKHAIYLRSSAMGLYTKLANRNPIIFRPKLAFEKMNLSYLISGIGEVEEAIKLATEAVIPPKNGVIEN